jgi:biopolymer transport protein ExbD
MSTASQLAGSDSAQMNMTPMIDIVFNLLIFFMLVVDLKSKDLAELTLPVASQAEQDKADDPDDRVLLNLDKYGQVHWKGKAITLDELGTILSNMRDRYEIKLKNMGKSPYDEIPGGGKASKLYVLLRADKDAPWQHVQWLMTVMAEQKLYKLQFATKKYLDGFIGKEEGRELDGLTQKEAQALEAQGG